MKESPSEVGARAERAVASALMEAGWHIYAPLFAAHGRVDLVAVGSGHTLRLQCKSALLLKSVLYFRTCSLTNNKPRPYTGEVDAFGVYSHDLRRAYLVPLEGLGDSGCYLRLYPPANNQAKGIRFAADYEIGRASPSDSPRLAV